MKYIWAITVISALAVNPAYAQLYEYKDENGNIVFTDSPPAGSSSQKKKFKEESVFRSNVSEKDYDSRDASSRRAGQGGQQNKDYSRVSVTMYVATW